MLWVALVAYTGLVQDIDASPTNNPIYYNNTFTTTNDPWSPVVGDTEGAPVPTEEPKWLADADGRRAAFNLVENIRKKLMRDNYDYVSDYNEHPSAKTTHKMLLMSAANTTKQTRRVSSKLTPGRNTRPVQLISYRTTRKITRATPRHTPIQMQVASVSIQVKGKNKKFFRDFNSATRFRSLDHHEPQTPATRNRDLKSDIVVSKQDLLFYIDDSRLRRKNYHSNTALIGGRRSYDNSTVQQDRVDKKIVTTKDIGKRDKYEKQGLNWQNSTDLYDNDHEQQYIADYAYDENNQLIKQLENKTKAWSSYPGPQKVIKVEGNNNIRNNNENKQNSLYDSNSIEQIGIVRNNDRNKKEIRQQNLKSDDKKINLQNSLYSDEDGEKEGTNGKNKENVQTSVDHQQAATTRVKTMSMQRNLSTNTLCTPSSDQYDTTIRRTEDEKQFQLNEKIIEQPSYEDQFVHFRDYDNRRIQKSNGKPDRRLDNSQERDSFNNKQISNKNKIKKYEQMERSAVNSNSEYKTVENSRNKESQVIHKNTEKQKSKLSQSGNIDKGINQHKISTDKEDVHKIPFTESRRHYNENEYKKNINVKVDSANVNKINDTSQYDDLNCDLCKQGNEPNDERIQNENLVHKNNYVENVDSKNTDINIGGRLISKGNKQSAEADGSHNNQNYTQDVQENTSPKAKYKLLKMRESRGSRRSYGLKRQFIEERGSTGVALIALDDAPFPQFRLPRSRRQYMDDHVDRRPPLLEQMARRSLKRRHPVRRRKRKNQRLPNNNKIQHTANTV